MKAVLRTDPNAMLFRLFRWTWNRGQVGDGKGYSCKLSVALAPRLFGFRREHEGWILTMLGIRVHFAKSYGGIFTAIFALLLLASQADAQGPIRRLLFGQRAVQRCESAPQAASVSKPCPCETCPDCKACCKDGVCEVPSGKITVSERDVIRWISPSEFESILKDLDSIKGWEGVSAILRKQGGKGWEKEAEIPVSNTAYIQWLKAIDKTESPMRALNGKTFAGALQTQLAKKEKLSPGERRLLRILNSEDSPRRDRQLARMERIVRADLNLPAGPADWGAIDWPSVLVQVLQLLVQLLPLFL